MRTDRGGPHAFAPTAASGTRLLHTLLLAGTILLLVVVALTFPAPRVPSLSKMEKVTVSAPNVMLECRATTVGGFPSETCYWTLRLDEGNELWWPLKDSKGTSGYLRDYFRVNGPVTFSSWEGRAYQIQLHNGQVYLDYTDGHDFQWKKQWIGVVVGFLVAAISLTAIRLELRCLGHPDTARRAGEASSCLGIFCLAGILPVAAFGWPRMWTGVIGLALFAALAPSFGQDLIRRGQARALRQADTAER